MRSINELLNVIRTGDTAEKGEAIYELGMHDDTRQAIPILIQLLSDEDWGELASTSLQRIGETARQPVMEYFKTMQGTGKGNAADIIVHLIFSSNNIDFDADADGRRANIAGFLENPGGLNAELAQEICKASTWGH